MIMGAFYFWGLWVTIRGLFEARMPGRLMAISYMVRVLVVLSGFYVVMGGHWERLIVAMIGFILMREILLRRFGKKAAFVE
jgi:F1F0 ATPase subunit 2